MRVVIATAIVLIFGMHDAAAQQVGISGRDTPVDLDRSDFRKYEPKRSRSIKSIYYDSANQYLVYQIRRIYYQRCEVPPEVVEEWMQTSSADSYLKQKISDRYPCRDTNTPAY
jgi:hypothetical protein